jgi:hypothetical protein
MLPCDIGYGMNIERSPKEEVVALTLSLTMMTTAAHVDSDQGTDPKTEHLDVAL